MDCVVHSKDDRSFNINVYRKPTHTDQYSFILIIHWSRGEGEGARTHQGNIWSPKLNL